MMRVPPVLLAADARRGRAAQAIILALGCGVARLVDPDRPLPFDVCGFRLLTGLPCPACGLTRSLCHALRGEWSASVGYHPAGVLLAALSIGWALWSAVEASRGQLLGDRLRRGISSGLMASGAAVSLVAWAVRLLTT